MSVITKSGNDLTKTLTPPEMYGILTTANALYSTGRYSDFATILTTIGANDGTILVDSAVTIAADTTIPANVSVQVIKSGSFAVDTDKTLTINGSFTCGLFQCFSGAGSVVFGSGTVSEVYPQWWGVVRDGATDDTAAIQAAINCAAASKANVFISAGRYKVTTITLPMTQTAPDVRDTFLRIYGHGSGEPFAMNQTRGTTLISTTNAVVLQDIDGGLGSNGTVEIDHLRFEGNSTSSIIKLQSFYGQSTFHHNTVYQAGVGNGVDITYGATWNVHDNYVLNRDWAATGMYSSRVGIGFNITMVNDNGLQTLEKNTSRGFLTGYSIAATGNKAIAINISKCECSTVYNGIVLVNTEKAIIDGCYFEGGEAGTGISDDGSYTTIKDCIIYPGFGVGIKADSLANVGTVITGNVVNMGTGVNNIGIAVGSSGIQKTVIGNTIIAGAGVNGTVGVKLTGTSPIVTILGNRFDPLSKWTGTDAYSILDSSTGNVSGLIQAQDTVQSFNVLGDVSLVLHQGITLTESNVSGNTLTIPAAGSYFVCTPTISKSIQIISTGNMSTRFVTFRVTNANLSFTNTAYIKLAGAGTTFTGPGTITFLIENVAGSNYAYEISRSGY